MMPIIVGARASALSRVQVTEVEQALQRFYPEITFAPLWMQTVGDRERQRSLRDLEKSDFFTREIDESLLKGTCRLSIHSAKDLPDPLPLGLSLLALTEGVDPSDVLVMRKGANIETLSYQARIGTSSLRREEMVRSLRSDLVCADIRGTILERIALLEGEIEGVVMAEAALIRLGLTHLNRVILPGKSAALQGQLAVVGRSEDEEMRTLLRAIDVRKA